ncbi:MAG: hypothetical protein HYX84_08360, partial [Chloroflexi bacterium]|nr:hypothetical protein [Chloroflexota bacterium]
MTVQLSPHKVKKILRGYFAGVPQISIARGAEVDQATVSHYATRFRKTAARMGIIAAAKEYGVLNEVDGLRSLSVELNKSRLSVREATKGHDIVRAFLKLGVKPEEHLTLLKVCREVGDPDFVRVAVKLVQIESQTGIPGDELVSRYEQAQARLPVLEANIARRQAELKSVNDELSQNKQALAAQRKEFEQYQKDVKARETEMDTGLAAKMAELAVKKEETEGAAVLKSILSQKGLSLETLIKLAQEFGERKGGKIKEVDSAKLNEALKVFSSLQEANIHLKNQNKSYQQWNQRFKEDYPSQSFQWAALVKKIEGCEATEKDVERRLREKSKELEALGNEYELFCGFMAMVHGSSSVTESTGMLIDLFQHLKDHGWSLSRSPEEMRGLFIRVIMGDHLKSFRCDYCGSKFITNGKPGSKS